MTFIIKSLFFRSEEFAKVSSLRPVFVTTNLQRNDKRPQNHGSERCKKHTNKSTYWSSVSSLACVNVGLLSFLCFFTRFHRMKVTNEDGSCKHTWAAVFVNLKHVLRTHYLQYDLPEISQMSVYILRWQHAHTHTGGHTHAGGHTLTDTQTHTSTHIQDDTHIITVHVCVCEETLALCVWVGCGGEQRRVKGYYTQSLV